MIKILFIHRRMDCGGVEQALFDLINLMDKSLFDITVLLQQEGGAWEHKFLDAGIRLTHVYDCQKSSHNPVVKGMNFIKRIRLECAWKQNGRGALNVALPENFDIVVKYGAITFDEMCFHRNAKTIQYIHGDINTNMSYRDYILKRTKLLPRFDRIICVSEQAHSSFVEQTGISEHVTTLYNPLDTDKIKLLAKQKNDLPTGLPLICAVGRLSEEKGFVRLIRIHKSLLDKGYLHRLVLVGDGEERLQIENTIQQTETQESVILTGYQENPYPYMTQSDFLVCSSYTEGLPVIAMEALSLGIPIVSSVPSIGEIFGSEQCGIITQNDDSSLEAGIERMLTDKDFYHAAKQAAKKRSQFFNGKNMVQKTEILYSKLLN